MPQRFFLNGIQCKCSDLSIVDGYNLPIPILARPAKTGLPFFELTAVRTKFTCLFHLCRVTSKRSIVYSSEGRIPAFLRAMEICCSGVLTPSRFGNSRPRFQPLETITPYRFASSSATDATRSGFPSTSTLYSSWPSSSSATEWNRGSCVPAEIAFSMISSATHTVSGSMVPMQPRSCPSFFRETNTPAACEHISAGASSGRLIRSPVRTYVSSAFLARRT